MRQNRFAEDFHAVPADLLEDDVPSILKRCLGDSPFELSGEEGRTGRDAQGEEEQPEREKGRKGFEDGDHLDWKASECGGFDEEG